MDPREWLFDRRVVSRNLDKGVLKQKDYNEYLKGIADAGGETEIIDVYGNLEEAEAVEEIAPIENDAVGEKE